MQFEKAKAEAHTPVGANADDGGSAPGHAATSNGGGVYSPAAAAAGSAGLAPEGSGDIDGGDGGGSSASGRPSGRRSASRGARRRTTRATGTLIVHMFLRLVRVQLDYTKYPMILALQPHQAPLPNHSAAFHLP